MDEEREEREESKMSGDSNGHSNGHGNGHSNIDISGYEGAGRNPEDGLTGCIILNYNDWETTMALVEEIRDYECLDAIIVVDNHSTDDSWEILSGLKGQPGLHLLRTEKNGGYGMGNQAGICYAAQELGIRYVLIANPDIHITQSCIREIRQVLRDQEDAGAASARVISPEGKELFSYWDLLPLWKDLLDTGLFTRRIFKSMLYTPPYGLKKCSQSRGRVVGAVPGSCFMIDLGRLTPAEAEELFDPGIFLYCEEKVLGQKLKASGLKVVLAAGASYVHAHSVSIDKSVSGIWAKQRLLHQSKLYYYKEYLHADKRQLAAARLFLNVVLAEVWFLTRVCGMRW